MGKQLDIDDCCAQSELAKDQLATLRRHNTELYALTSRVANLNPDAGEIGEGMLRQLVFEARRLTE